MMNNKFKVLVYLDNYVDETFLHKGIYSTEIPNLYPENYTKQDLIDTANKIYSIMGKDPTTYITNIEHCDLIEITISF